MTFVLLMIRFLVMFAGLFGVIALFVYVGKKLFPEEKTTICNFKVKFDAVKKQYYITNQLADKHIDVTNWLGNRVYYKNKAEADFITQKLNEN